MRFRIRSLGVILILLSVFVAAPRLQAATSADYYQAGLQLYNAKNYALAVQYFGAAISLDPNNLAAYQGRANCEYTLGNKAAALADYQRVESVQPNPQLAQFIQALQAQVGYVPPQPNVAAMQPAPPKDITFSKKYDVRLTFGASMMSLDDFKADASLMWPWANTRKAWAIPRPIREAFPTRRSPKSGSKGPSVSARSLSWVSF